jgi:hypothetical protein
MRWNCRSVTSVSSFFSPLRVSVLPSIVSSISSSFHVGQLSLQHQLVLVVAVNVDHRNPRAAVEIFLRTAVEPFEHPVQPLLQRGYVTGRIPTNECQPKPNHVSGVDSSHADTIGAPAVQSSTDAWRHTCHD